MTWRLYADENDDDPFGTCNEAVVTPWSRTLIEHGRTCCVHV